MWGAVKFGKGRMRALALTGLISYRAAERDAARVNKIDLNLVWDDARAMGRANRDLLTAIAGMFLLLPSIVAGQFSRLPPPLESGAEPAAAFARLMDYAALNWPVLLLHSIVTAFGMLAMLSLLLRREHLTVGQSLHAALLLLPAYVLAVALQRFGIMCGMTLFFLPGFYLIGRLALIAPVAAAERPGNPLTILRRSAELTMGNGWRIFLMLAMVFIAATAVGLAVTSVVGVSSALLLPKDVAALLVAIASGLVEAGIGVAIMLMTAALYRVAMAPAARRRG